MQNKTNIFDAHELFNLTCAQYFANKQEQETGISSDWSEFAGNFQGEFAKLSQNEQDKLDVLLNNMAIKAKDDIKRLTDLKEDDFDNQEDFINERRDLQKDITEMAIENLKNYWNEN